MGSVDKKEENREQVARWAATTDSRQDLFSFA